MLLAGLDIGTTGCKISVFSTGGEFLGRVYRDYPNTRTTSQHEIDAVLIWKAVQEVLTEASAKWPDIGSIGVTSFGETFVLLDKNDQPLSPSMLYTDPRGAEECEWLSAKLGRDIIAGITGLNPHPMYSIPKLMWVKRHKPEIWSNVGRVCQMKDYIVYLLTGNAQIDYSLASRTMAFDIKQLIWNDQIFDAAGIDKALLSAPVPIGTCAGTVKPEIAKSLGLNPKMLVVSSGQDQVAAAVGSGIFDEDVAVDGAGTVECITPVFRDIENYDSMINNSYAIVPYIEDGKYVCYAFSFTGGAAVQWFTENLAGYAANHAAKKGMNIYKYFDEYASPSGPTGLLVLPHFAGAATPHMDYNAKAAIVGLTLSTTQADIFNAIMEGVCYEMRLNVEQLTGAGIEFKKLRATGGGANSRVWMQMKADILNLPVTSLSTVEAGGAGAAMMAGVAAGVFADLREAAGVMVEEKETFVPRGGFIDGYSFVYEKYKGLYASLKPYF